LALSGVTVALAHEFSEDGIRVNGIAPGMMTGRLPEELIRTIVAQQLIKRRGTAEDLVEVLLLLCSERSSFITGQTIHVDGGVAPRP
jgi:3-oxoacyl-[acyl-carrier protein] reductase